MSSSNSVCVHCGEMYEQHEPAPRLSSLMPPARSSTRVTTPCVPLLPPPPSHLSLPIPPFCAVPQLVPPPLPPRPSQLHTSSQSVTMGPFYPPGPSMVNRPLGVASGTGAATALPYSMYSAPQPFTTASTQATGKRKRGRGRASQLVESACPRRHELTVVVDCQAVSTQLPFTCTS